MHRISSSSGFNILGVHFDPMLLFSDHRPIWMRVSSQGEKGESGSDSEEMTN